MKIKSQPIKIIIHYILIYFTIILNQSQLYEVYISKYNLIIIGGLFFLLISKTKYRDLYSLVFLAFMLAAVAFGRIYVGGIGLRAWELWAVKILGTLYAIQYNKELFMNRYVKVVTFLAGASIIGFVLNIVSPQVLHNVLIAHYEIEFKSYKWLSATKYIATPYHADGLLFFALREDEKRNCGIFTEPGVYQMVLNSALFVILFLKDYIYIEDKNKAKCLLILLLAIITCQSTTGYIGAGAIILMFCVSKQRNIGNLKFKFIIIIVIGLGLLFVDYMVRGTESFLSTAFFSKLITSSGSVDINASTGQYRFGTIMLTISSMIQHPLGIGYNDLYALMNGTDFVAAQILQTGAVLGVVPLLAILFWIFKPIVKSRVGTCAKLLYIFIYFNTALAQSSEFYPTLIIIPMFLYLTSRARVKSEAVVRKREYFKIANERYVL